MENRIQPPISSSESRQENGLLRRIAAQGQVDWVIATLTIRGKSLRNQAHPGEVQDNLRKILRETIRRVEYKVLGGNAIKRRKDRLLCVPAFGGEPKNGTYVHYHLLLEMRSKRPMDLEEFRRLLEAEWNKQLTRIRRWDPRVKEPLVGEVWMDHAWDSLDRYVGYIQRPEGATLESGMDKVDLSNLFLKHKDDATLPERNSLCC